MHPAIPLPRAGGSDTADDTRLASPEERALLHEELISLYLQDRPKHGRWRSDAQLREEAPLVREGLRLSSILFLDQSHVPVIKRAYTHFQDRAQAYLSDPLRAHYLFT